MGFLFLLEEIGFDFGWLKIGILVCFDGCIIYWDWLEEQFGDEDLILFFVLMDWIMMLQILCYIIWMMFEIYQIIWDNLFCFVMYFGEIKGRGLCYCLLIEDKIVCFGDCDGYQIFLELEGLDDYIVYLNGILMFFLEDVQLVFLKMILGLEDVEVIQLGYVIEYDYVDLCELRVMFEVKWCD